MYSTSQLRIGKNLISIGKAEQLDPQRKTLYRLKLAPSPYEPELPRNVIIKQRKEGWENEFDNEEKVYQQLQDLQGTRIPRFFGRILFRGVPSLVLSQVEWPPGFQHTDVQRLPTCEKRHLLIAIARITDMSDILEAAKTIQSERGLLMHAEINRLSRIYIVARYRASTDYER